MSKIGRKSNTVEYEEKITEALELILYKKLSSGEFRTTYSKTYQVTERAADAVWKKCKDIIKDRFLEEQGEIINQQLSRYFDLLDRARKDGNKRVERETLDSITKLYGIEGTKKIDITSGGESISININLNDE
jgi:hypothetical protein